MSQRTLSPRALPLTIVLTCAQLCTPTAPLCAQQLIGYVSTRDADVKGATDILDDKAVLMGSVSVTAKDHTAPISLGRGGTVRVCQTSVLHLTESRQMMVAAPLLFSLDRGAIEIQTSATPTDAVMTPDLRFTVRSPGQLDLRLRVARNGDTCVENRGSKAPTLIVSDPFGESSYELHADQHVLFEHGSLREVVDHERLPCGCPDERGLSVADALMASGGAAAQHPFPAAVSEGLAPAAEIPQAALGEVHAQASETLHYNAQQPTQPAPATSASPAAPAAAPAPRPPSKDLVHVVGRFFRRLFWRSG